MSISFSYRNVILEPLLMCNPFVHILDSRPFFSLTDSKMCGVGVVFLHQRYVEEHTVFTVLTAAH